MSFIRNLLANVDGEPPEPFRPEPPRVEYARIMGVDVETLHAKSLANLKKAETRAATIEAEIERLTGELFNTRTAIAGLADFTKSLEPALKAVDEADGHLVTTHEFAEAMAADAASIAGDHDRRIADYAREVAP